MAKQGHFPGIKTMMMYSDNMIAQKVTSSVISDTNKWSHSSVGKNHKKIQSITINNGDGEMTPLCLEKKMMIYNNNMTAHQSTSNVISYPNKLSHSYVKEIDMRKYNDQQK